MTKTTLPLLQPDERDVKTGHRWVCPLPLNCLLYACFDLFSNCRYRKPTTRRTRSGPVAQRKVFYSNHDESCVGLDAAIRETRGKSRDTAARD